MYLHLGKGNMVSRKNLIFIGQMECLQHSEISRNFMEREKQEKNLIDVSDGNPQSFIVTDDKVYTSLISASTLQKRVLKKTASLER